MEQLTAGSQSYDFFEVQRRARIRSRVLIGGMFLLVWLIANGLLAAAHTRRTCSVEGVCESAWHANWGVLAITALVVAGYLALAPWVAGRFMVAGRGMRVARDADGVVLRNVVEEVAIAAGVPAPQAFILHDPSLNAFAVSDGRRHGAVVVTSGLLAALDRRELAGVVAHEIAHIRNRDSRVILVAVFAVGAVLAAATAVSALAAGLARASSGSRDKDSGHAVLMVVAALVVVAAVVLRLVAVPAAMVMRAALSRRREQLADASAVQYTRDPGGLRRALEKISVGAAPLHRANALARPLCIESAPAQGDRFARWLDTHPPIADRIAWLRLLERA